MTEKKTPPTIKLASILANIEREIEGDWIEYPDWPGVAFHVSSFNKPAYLDARDQMQQRLAKEYRGEKPPQSVFLPLQADLYCSQLLHGWRGLDTEYSPTTAANVLSRPEARDLVSAIEWCAGRVAAIKLEFVNDLVGNSEPLSAGNSAPNPQTGG